MNANEVMEIGKGAIWVLLEMSIPILMVALIVGLVISLFQALTQIQEATLSFVPKIIAISIAMVVFLPMMGEDLIKFSNELFSKIATIEKNDSEE